jgi:transcriptional regulator with XRE-family HTH domain
MANIAAATPAPKWSHLARARILAGYSQQQVADTLIVSKRLVGIWEADRNRVRPIYRGPLAELYGVPVTALWPELHA